MRKNVASNGNVNGGLSRLAKLDFENKIASLAQVPANRRLVAYPIIRGKVNGVPVDLVELAARKPGQIVYVQGGQLRIAAV